MVWGTDTEQAIQKKGLAGLPLLFQRSVAFDPKAHLDDHLIMRQLFALNDYDRGFPKLQHSTFFDGFALRRPHFGGHLQLLTLDDPASFDFL